MPDAMRAACRISAPANLLLLGEYAVLEEGGLGIAIAPDVRATARSVPGPDQVVGHLPGGTVRWPGDDALLGRIACHLRETFGEDTSPGSVDVDTQAFFDATGRKRGYGSSAAVAVVLTALWMLRAGTIAVEHGTNQTPPLGPGATGSLATGDRAAIFHNAVAAHRAGQGGAGSGYDVACSSYGGALRFVGGAQPTAARIDLAWLPPMALFAGRHAVATSGAVARLKEWRSNHTARWKEFFRTSNMLVESFSRATSWPEAAQVLNEYRTLTLRFGSQIGVSAEIAPPEPMPTGTAFKAVGAGNELGVAFIPQAGRSRGGPEDADDSMTPISIALEGVTWEEDCS